VVEVGRPRALVGGGAVERVRQDRAAVAEVGRAEPRLEGDRVRRELLRLNPSSSTCATNARMPKNVTFASAYTCGMQASSACVDGKVYRSFTRLGLPEDDAVVLQQ